MSSPNPWEEDGCEKCADKDCEDGRILVEVKPGDEDDVYEDCHCRCHMDISDLEAEEADAAYDRWKEDRED